jgi:hypothetical protein
MGLRTVSVIGTRLAVRSVQESGSIKTDIDKGSLHSGQNSGDLSLVDVSYNSAGTRALDVKLLEHAIFHDRYARFLRSHVNQDLFAHSTSNPISFSNPASSYNGNIAARLIGGLARLPVPSDLARRKRAKCHAAGIEHRAIKRAVYNRNRRQYLVNAPGQAAKHVLSISAVAWLSKNLAVKHYTGVGGNDRPSFKPAFLDQSECSLRLLGGNSSDVSLRRHASAPRLRYVGHHELKLNS